MKTKLLILFLIFFGIISCNSQESKSEKQVNGTNKPHEKFHVERKYDEHGNLIAFDSTYTSYYSSHKGDTLIVDSIMRNFETYFNRHIPEIGSDYLFGSDSTFHRDFFSDDFFEKQFIHQNEFMLKMIQEMDSVKNEFFQIHSQNMKI